MTDNFGMKLFGLCPLSTDQASNCELTWKKTLNNRKNEQCSTNKVKICQLVPLAVILNNNFTIKHGVGMSVN